ncbi:MAG: zinc ribbon domain-containing protein [Eubacterium sp.]|nr:zinc ribbon domain-containing protein [Eubacterium sp.]
MNCPNCGAALPDGAMFCGACGNKIVSQQMGQPQMQQMGQPQMQQMGQPQFQQPQMQPGMMQPGMMPNGMYMQQPSQAGFVFGDMWRLFAEGITRPFSAAKSVAERGRGIQGLLIAIFGALVAFFLILIHLPYGNYSTDSYFGYSYSVYSVGDRALQAFLTFLVVAAVYLLTATAGYIFRDKSKPQYSFKNILGMLGSVTVYPLFVAGLEFIFGLFSAPIAGTFETVMIIIWVGFSTVVLKEVIGGTEEGKTVKAVFSNAVVICGVALLCDLITLAAKTSVGILF